MSVQLSPEPTEAAVDEIPITHFCRTHRHDWECTWYPQECQAYCNGMRLEGGFAEEGESQDCIVCEYMWLSDPRQKHHHR